MRRLNHFFAWSFLDLQARMYPFRHHVVDDAAAVNYAWLRKSVPGSMLREDSGTQVQLKDRRSSLRQILPSGVPASIHLPSGRTGFVMLGDISRAGACIVRRGLLEVKPSDQVFINISDYGLLNNVYLSACVKWINTLDHKILVGLSFTEGPLLPGTILDQYFDRALLAPGACDV